ncbi:MAG TPA: uroporphyrinogen-III synthase [Anaerolineales bacterium]|jgi:uroporphyrinogen-III synthase|nr:uroporphyrinogen-III synthase [Anaerolineales bacterium]
MDLNGKQIVITRPRAQADEFAAAFETAGAVPILFPVIEIGPIDDTTALDRALQKLNCYEWLVLTSVNGVQVVWERFAALGLGAIPEDTHLAAIGPKTAEALEERGAPPDFVPSEYVAEAILPGLGDLRGRWVLLPRADLARSALPRAIQVADGVAHEIAVYHTLPARPDPEAVKALKEGVDVVTFTSSSTVRNFVALLQKTGLDASDLPGKPVLACIGPVTAETALEEGLAVDIVAQEYTTEGLLRALVEA